MVFSQQLAKAWIFLLPGALSGAQLTADSVTLSPSTSGSVVISYSSLGDLTSDLQFDLVFDSSAISVLVVPGPSIRSAGKQLYTANLGAGLVRILVAGLNENSLNDGGMVTVFVNVAPNAGAGAYTGLLNTAVGADPSGNAVTIPNTLAPVPISTQSGTGTAMEIGPV